MTSISQIQTKLSSIQGLKLLQPVVIPEQDLDAIARLCDKPGDATAWINYHLRLPITIAHIKKDAEREILGWCREQTETYNIGILEPSKELFLKEKAEGYASETKLFARALFGGSVEDSGCRAQGGFFKGGEERVKSVHGDNIQQFTCKFLTRVGALPTEFIAERDRRNADPEIKKLIKKSKQQDGHAARDNLRERGILKSANLGDVILFADGTGATLHCSSPIPAGGAHSFFFASSQYIKGVRPNDLKLLKHRIAQKLCIYR